MLTLRKTCVGGLFAAILLARPAHAGGTADIEWMSGGHNGGVNSLATTPDGTTLVTASSLDETIKIWDRADQHLIRTIPAAFTQVHSVAVSPDGTLVASGQDWLPGYFDSTVKIWSLESGALVRGLSPGAFYDVNAVAFSPDGTVIAAACSDSNVRTFDVNGGLLHTFTGHSGFVNDVAFSPDGTLLASGANDNTVKIWNVRAGTLSTTLTGHTFFVMSVRFKPDGSTLSSGSWDGTIKLWNPVSGALIKTLIAPSGSVIDSLDWLSRTTIAGAGSDDAPAASIRVWDIDSGAIVTTIPAHPAGVFQIECAYNGGVIRSGGADGLAQEWDAASKAKLATFGVRRGSVFDVAFSDDSSLFATADSLNDDPDPSAHYGDIELWDPNTGVMVDRLIGQLDVVNAIGFSPDGELLVAGGGSPGPGNDWTIKVWDLASSSIIQTLPGHFDGTTAVDISNDKQFVASWGRDGALKIWSLASGTVIKNTFVSVQELAFSPDGSLLATASGSGIKLWLTSDWSLFNTIPTPAGVERFVWSPDGSSIAVALSMYGDNVQIRAMPSGALLHSFEGDVDGFMQSVAFAPDGATLVCASGYTHTIQVWEVASETLLDQFTEETGWGIFPRILVALSGDGAHLGYARDDGTLVMATSPAKTPETPGDLDGDGDVDASDLALLLGSWGRCEGCTADLDGNGTVDAADLGILLGGWTG